VANSGSFVIDALTSGVSKSYVFTSNEGFLTRSTSIVGVSDERVKKEIQPSTLGLDIVKSLNPVSFKWDEVELGDSEENPQKLKVQLGLIAQDVRRVLETSDLGSTTGLVVDHENQDFYKDRLKDTDVTTEPVLALDYIQLIPILIKSIQELSDKIDNLETKREE
jgi:hypothetical protein